MGSTKLSLKLIENTNTDGRSQRCRLNCEWAWGKKKAGWSKRYNPTRLMDHRIMVQFGYWFRITVVPY